MLPDDLLWVVGAETEKRGRVVPGTLRVADVKVGRHIAVSSGSVPRFLEHFESAYGKLGKTDRILSAATAHHRLLWVQPFLDGNGRVTKLMSPALQLSGLETGEKLRVTRRR